MDLNKYFKGGCMRIGMEKNIKTIPFPGTVQDFLEWLGNTDQKAVEAMKFDELELQPAMEKYYIDSIGAGAKLGQKVWKFRIRQDSKNLNRGEDYISRRMDDYNNAFLAGLILIWEMVMRRK